MDGFEIEIHEDGLWRGDGDLFDTLEEAIDFAQMVYDVDWRTDILRIVHIQNDAVVEVMYSSDLGE